MTGCWEPEMMKSSYWKHQRQAVAWIIRRKAMNKRQWEKRYKRKWQQLMSDKASELLHIKVKPSRIKMRTEKTESSVSVIGLIRYLEFKITFTKKPKDEGLHKALENLSDEELMALHEKVKEAADAL